MAMTEEAKAVHEDDPCPQPPAEIPPEQCCASGCEVCVYDHYNAALRQYYRDKTAWEARNATQAQERV